MLYLFEDSFVEGKVHIRGLEIIECREGTDLKKTGKNSRFHVDNKVSREHFFCWKLHFLIHTDAKNKRKT